ncbi:MAG: carbon-nitrogen hydrolase family protein [Candidatus Thiodiazotropha sp.]
MPTLLRVAAVQMNSCIGEIAKNLSHAEKMIAYAVNKGAKLVLLPELMPSGYTLSEDIWNFAETINGETVGWLLDTARRFGIYIGFTFPEANGEDFFNTFVLSDPKGELIGRVRKNPPSSVEAYFFRSASDAHVIETEIGRIGIGICYENTLFDHMRYLFDQDVDLVLSPAAAGRPMPFIPGDVKRFEHMLVNSRSIFAHTLGVPVIVSNRVGSLETTLPGSLPYLKSSFPGLSSIVDFDGTVKAELGDEEGTIVADIHIGNDSKRKAIPKRYGNRWGIAVPWYAFIWPLTQKMGEKRYENSTKRKQCALSICQGKKGET